MSTRSTPSRPPSRRITDVVHRSLKTALQKQRTPHHTEDMRLRRMNQTSSGQRTCFQLEYRDLIHMAIRITATHVGGNVYDVECAVQDGPSRTFSYSLPGESGVALSRAPCLGLKLGTFLHGELERRLGRQVLRRENE